MNRVMGKDIKNILVGFIFWRLALFFLGFFALTLFPHQIEGRVFYPENFDFLSSWANWDGGHFIGIAKNGYVKDSQYAFFPLYPILIKLVSFLTLGNLLIAGLIVSNIFAFWSLLVFYKLSRFDLNVKESQKAVLYFLFFPTAFFLGAVYSESLFLFLSLCAFYFARRGNYLSSSIFASFASATNPLGIILVPALIFEYLAKQKFSFANIRYEIFYFLVAPLGLLSYMTFLFLERGDPFIFLTAQANWQRELTFPWTTLFSFSRPLFILDFFGSYAYSQRILEFIFALFAVFIFIFSFRFVRKSYFIFGFLFLISFFSTGSLVSSPRIILPLFPMFIYLAILGRNFLFDFSYLFFSALLSTMFLALFLNGFWIA